MSAKKKNQEEETETNDEAFAGKKSDGKHVPGNDDGPLAEGKGSGHATKEGPGYAAGNGNGEGDGDQQTDKSDEGTNQQQDQTEVNDGGLGKNLEDENEGGEGIEEEEEEEFKGKTYSEAFEKKEGNPRRHSWPEGQVIEFFETVAYKSFPPDGARKDLYTPTEDDIKATDWEDANAD